VEPELRRDWETRYPDKPWDRARDHVRDSWDTAKQRLQLHEEQLHANKQAVNAGEVAVRKDVVTERREMDVPVRREEVVVERHDVPDRPASGGDFGSGREEIRVPLREEEVTLEKRPVVTEEIEVGKRTVQDTEHVAGTVRKEVPRVEKTGDVTVRGDAGLTGATAGDWSTVMPTYRQHWQSSYGNSGERWEEYEPVYRYSWEMRNDPRFRGRRWAEVEPELRRDWESHHNMPWDKAGRAMRDAWDSVTARV
jgi:uncharacterized protein (TIGR02271 family)